MGIVEGKHLFKNYNGLRAVDDVSFSIERMECFGFLGPNGAGKTSVMKMIYCRSPIDKGDITVDGLDVRTQPRAVKGIIGVGTQDDNLDRDLTIFENLLVYSRYFDIPASVATKRIDGLLGFFDLKEKRNTAVDDLSGGMRRKLIVARALVNDPKILILDEPTTGLDPQARRQIWDTIVRLKREGKTIILTTHYMDEAQELCDRIAVMFNGRILELDTPSKLIQRIIGKNVCELQPQNDQETTDIRNNIPAHMEQVGSRLYIYGDDADILRRQCESVTGVSQHVRPASLEDVFLKLTGRKLK